jgi:hypothetical protein
MMRPALAALVLTLTLLGTVAAQQGSPFELPMPQGGPIIGPDGKVMSALDKTLPPWGGTLQLGLSGASGNVDILKIWTGLDIRYDSPDNVFRLYGLYALSWWDGQNIEQKAFLTARDEIPFAQSWAWYGQGAVEYDQFRTVDFRLGGHNGITYTAYSFGGNLLKVRAGIGMSREFGSPRKDWVPEAQFGGDYEYRITTRTAFCATADYYPDIHDFNQYRLRARASLDFLIDPDLNLLLRIGVMDRFDSQPYGSKKNDLDYFTTLMLRF